MTPRTRDATKTKAIVGKWTGTSIPDFEGAKAFVLGGAFEGSGIILMAEAGFTKATTIEEADVVVFMGGVDVDPLLYGEKALRYTQHPSQSRDKYETECFHYCVENNKVMFGICRGAQFLHVMNGGKLWQHVNNHSSGDHLIYDLTENVTIVSTSMHHQMLRLNTDIDVVATTLTQIATSFISEKEEIGLEMLSKSLGPVEAGPMVEMEIEAGIYWGTRCFFVQGHPEVGGAEFRSWTMTKLREFQTELAQRDLDEACDMDFSAAMGEYAYKSGMVH